VSAPGAPILFPSLELREWSAEKRSGACEAPLADLAIDPTEHRAKAFAHLAIDVLAFRRPVAAFFGFG
jgi:hypothetical protein